MLKVNNGTEAYRPFIMQDVVVQKMKWRMIKRPSIYEDVEYRNPYNLETPTISHHSGRGKSKKKGKSKTIQSESEVDNFVHLDSSLTLGTNNKSLSMCKACKHFMK